MVKANPLIQTASGKWVVLPVSEDTYSQDVYCSNSYVGAVCLYTRTDVVQLTDIKNPFVAHTTALVNRQFPLVLADYHTQNPVETEPEPQILIPKKVMYWLRRTNWLLPKSLGSHHAASPTNRVVP